MKTLVVSLVFLGSASAFAGSYQQQAQVSRSHRSASASQQHRGGIFFDFGRSNRSSSGWNGGNGGHDARCNWEYIRGWMCHRRY